MAEQKQEADLPETINQDDKSQKDNKKSKKQKKSKKTKTEDTDEELSELLDSALEDFTTCSNAGDGDGDAGVADENVKQMPPNSLWDEEFLKQLQQNFPSGFSSGDTPLTAEQLGQNIQSFAEAVTQIAGGEISPDIEFPNFFSQAVKQLSENPDSARRQEDDFNNLMANLGTRLDSSQDFNEMLVLMLSMMQNLLSKEVLYPDLKHITEKYPQWLEDNKEKLSLHEQERHAKQLEIVKEVCSELEKETANDSEEVKKARCERVLVLMLQVQDLGPIPVDIAGDLSPVLGLDNHGNPQLPPNLSPNQCSLM